MQLRATIQEKEQAMPFRRLCKRYLMTIIATAPLAVFLLGSASASPTDVPGLVLWLDADKARVTTDTDDLVSGWSDVVDTANNTKPDNVAQSDPDRRPRWVDRAINGLPALQFDGGDFLNNTVSNLVASGSARTVFVVGRLEDRSTGATVFAFRRSTSAERPLFGVNLYAGGDPPSMFLVYTDGSHGDRNTPIAEPGIALEALRRPFISTHRSAGSDQTIAVDLNGVPLKIRGAATVSTEGGFDGFTVGGSENLPDSGWHGLIAEVLVYDCELKAAERRKVGEYLAEKYGIPDHGVALLPRMRVVAVARRPDAFRTAVTLENDVLGAMFDSETGSLIQLANKLTDETMDVGGDEFQIEATEFNLTQKDMALVSLVKRPDEQIVATYRAEGQKSGRETQPTKSTIVVTWRLGEDRHFLEKQLVVKSSSPFGFQELVISRPAFGGPPVTLMKYRHMQTVTYFGRSPRGGIFVGVELAFDHSTLDGQNMVSLGYAPNLNVKAGEQIVCEPVYLGIYRKQDDEKEAKGLPLVPESQAMVAMTTAILPPTHPRLGPLMCGWWSETFRGPYQSDADAKHDMRSIDFAEDCGIDIISDGRTWSGETLKVNALAGNERFELSELVLDVAHYAHKKGVRWVFWPTMGNSDPWSGRGAQLRLDKPQWTMIHEGADRANSKPAACFGNATFYDWLLKVNVEAMDAGRYGAWCMDGDFAGGGGWGGGPAGSVHPARCHSQLHDHISPDIDYCCQRNLSEMAGLMRRRYPDVYMMYCRPPMDLGVWALRHVDASFTVNEWARLEGLPGMGTQPVNVLLGDKIRHWSRIRVHHHFFPHHLDSPQVFAAPKSMTQWKGIDWQSDHIDYIMLSALSSSPNQTYYLPSQAGIPAEDRRRIKKWLDWGRKHIDYIMVGKDLPDWPAAGKVDGSAHICDDQGFVFLFNPNKRPLQAEFVLTEPSIGLIGDGLFEVRQEHPVSDQSARLRYGEVVKWQIPLESAVLLRIEKLKDSKM